MSTLLYQYLPRLRKLIAESNYERKIYTSHATDKQHTSPYKKAPVKSKLKAAEETVDEGIKDIHDNKKFLALLQDEYCKTKDRIDLGLDLLLKQKLEEIHKLGGRLLKVEEEDNAETAALSLKIADTRKTKEKIERNVQSLQYRVKTAEVHVGYD